MADDKKNFDSITMFGSDNAAGVCGPDGCSIADHQKKVQKDKQADKQK